MPPGTSKPGQAGIKIPKYGQIEGRKGFKYDRRVVTVSGRKIRRIRRKVRAACMEEYPMYNYTP